MRCARIARRPVGLLIGITLAAGCATFATSASAAVSGLERVTATSEETSADKAMEVACPPGKVLLAAAGEITGGFGNVMLEHMAPVANLNRATVRGAEDNAYAPTWSVTAYGICSDPIPGLVRVRGSSSLNTSSLQQDAYAYCPLASAPFLISANGSMTGIGGEGVINEVGWWGTMGAHVMAREEDSFAGNWWASAVATCAPSTFPLLAQVTGDPTYGPSDSVTVTCPEGFKVTGAGGAIVDPTDDAHGHVSLDDIRPADDLRSVTVTAFETDDEQANAFTGDWQVRATALCNVA
jgi:hypothetical protein